MGFLNLRCKILFKRFVSENVNHTITIDLQMLFIRFACYKIY